MARLVLAVAVLLPLAAGVHAHGLNPDAQPPCGVCAIAKHAQAVIRPAAGVESVALRAEPPAGARVEPVLAPRSGSRPGRAPPADSSSRSV